MNAAIRSLGCLEKQTHTIIINNTTLINVRLPRKGIGASFLSCLVSSVAFPFDLLLFPITALLLLTLECTATIRTCHVRMTRV